MMEPTGTGKPRLQQKMVRAADNQLRGLGMTICTDALSTDEIIMYQSPTSSPLFRKARSWSARSRESGTKSPNAESCSKRARYNSRVPPMPLGSVQLNQSAQRAQRARACKKMKRLKGRAYGEENYAGSFFRHLLSEHDQKGAVSVKRFKYIARSHLPIEPAELKAFVYLSSAANDSANIDVKAAMLALEMPQTATKTSRLTVKERALPKALRRTVSLLKQNPCKKPAMTKYVLETNTAEAMRSMLTSRKLTDRGRRRQDFRTWITANTIKVGQRK